MFSVTAVAANSKTQYEKLTPFYEPEIRDIAACKHVTPGLKLTTSQPKPVLFANVTDIHTLMD